MNPTISQARVQLRFLLGHAMPIDNHGHRGVIRFIRIPLVPCFRIIHSTIAAIGKLGVYAQRFIFTQRLFWLPTSHCQYSKKY